MSALPGNGQVNFAVQVTDDSGSVQRVVALYRRLTDRVWSKVELTYNAGIGMATGSVSGLSGPFEYWAQAVDPTGNVALALDHGNPYQGQSKYSVYLPMIRR